ncbi:MAG: DUF459 domain-containing protein [Actinomycetota bacterium]|nr:DUF459 domain-containing protein [Actinomycetota bacterium]
MSQSPGEPPTPQVPARPRRRGPGRHVYAVRRLLAMCVVFALVAAVLAIVNLVVGDDDARDRVVASSSTSSSSSTSTTDATTTTTDATTTTVKPVTVPTRDDPAEMLVLGDSDAGNFGPPLESALEATGVVAVAIDYHVSSGLARPDFFDWPAYMRLVVPAINPDIVVATFGGNDAQGLRTVDGVWVVTRNPGQGKDDTAWKAEYGRRVGEVMDYLSAGNRTLIWVGIPNDDEEINTDRMRVQDEVVRAEAAARPRVVYIDTWAMFSGVDGGWAESIVDPRDGEGKDVRRGDGFHLNEVGGEILAWKIEQVVLDELRARGADL